MELAIQNPWWEGKEDIHVNKWNSMKIKWRPKWLGKLALEPFSLNFVIGPRQVGKTTGIKLLIHSLLKKHSPESIVYFNVELIADINAFTKFFSFLREHKKSEKIHTLFIFLDEVSHLPGWWRTVKGFIDAGVFENDVITVTSSSSLKIRKEAELFAGRTGKGKEVTVLPLSFPELADVFKLKAVQSEKVSELMRLYLRSGGFPHSLNNPIDATETFIKGFESEMLKANHSLLLTREILASIFKKVPSPLSFSTIARDTSARSHKTITPYLESMRSLFFLDFAYFMENKKINYRKERKIFFRDPFVALSLAQWCGQDFLESAVHEWIVQEHLLRRFGEVYYFKNSYEIDCISKKLKIEVKAGKPHRRYPKSVTVIDSEELPFFLLKLGKH